MEFGRYLYYNVIRFQVFFSCIQFILEQVSNFYIELTSPNYYDHFEVLHDMVSN